MILLNGKLLEPGAPETSLLNRSFKYGDGLFESMRVVRGKPIFLEEHLVRLARGMKALMLEYNDTIFSTIKENIGRLLDAKGIDGYGKLRLQIFRGGEGAYFPISNQVGYLIEAYALKDNPGINVPVRLGAYQDWPLSPTPLTGLKTSNALPYILAALHARQEGFDDALLFCKGKISEASSANIFILQDKALVTPPVQASCCLDGVMRKQLIRLCQQLKVRVKEESISEKALRKADEVFLTNSVRGIVPVRQYLEKVYEPSPGPMTAFLGNGLEQWIHDLAIRI